MLDAPPDNGIHVSLETLIALRREGIRLSLGQAHARAQLAGGYRSAFRGRGMDFEEVRAYQPGDDIRRMDWRVTARSNRPHTKLFREERERPVLLCVDTGTSMRFASRIAFKSVQACRAAALLGWAALENHDRIGAVTFANSAAQELRPAGGKRALLHCLQMLAAASVASPLAPTDAPLQDTLLRLRHLARHGTLVILISDVKGLDAAAEQHLGALAQHNDVMAIRIFDPLEAELPPPGHYAFSDGQQIQSLWTTDPVLRDQYHQEFADRSEYLASLCRRHRIRWLSLSTAEDTASSLQQYLQKTRVRAYASGQLQNVLAG
ncbi:MAG: DUF58 domain-containing protein [Gammaproteobacteria bacterium]